MAMSADWAEATQARRDLAGACGYLRILAGAITAAHRQEPVLAVDRAVLRAIPVATVPPRRLPEPRDSVAAICQGVIDAAERLRHSAGVAAGRPWSSPDVSADSLRHSAAAAVAASHHCSVLLGTLEERSGITVGRGEDVWAGFGLAVALAEAGQAAGRSRDSWQGVTRTLDQVTSDVPGQVGAEPSPRETWQCGLGAWPTLTRAGHPRPVPARRHAGRRTWRQGRAKQPSRWPLSTMRAMPCPARRSPRAAGTIAGARGQVPGACQHAAGAKPPGTAVQPGTAGTDRGRPICLPADQGSERRSGESARDSGRHDPVAEHDPDAGAGAGCRAGVGAV